MINHGMLNGLKGLHALCTVSLNGTFKTKLLGIQTDFTEPLCEICLTRSHMYVHTCMQLTHLQTQK